VAETFIGAATAVAILLPLIGVPGATQPKIAVHSSVDGLGRDRYNSGGCHVTHATRLEMRPDAATAANP
jgi:hypothetical protein